MFTVEEVCEEQERQYNRLMQEDDQYCHSESFKWGFEHGVDYALTKAGWHPASELPPLDEDGDSECVVGIWEDQEFSPFITIPLPVSGYVSYEDGEWTKPIKWWCYPPEDD